MEPCCLNCPFDALNRIKPEQEGRNIDFLQRAYCAEKLQANLLKVLLEERIFKVFAPLQTMLKSAILEIFKNFNTLGFM